MNAPIRDEDQLTRALHSSSSVYVDPDEGRE